jgi:transposase-like protein
MKTSAKLKAEEEMRYKRKSYSKQEKMDHVKACLDRIRQGRTIRSYVAEHEFSRSAMNEWLKHYRHEVALEQKDAFPSSLVRVKPIDSQTISAEQTSSLKVHVGTLSIELPAGNSEADLCRVLRALKEVL